jgi:hypothetical protein
MKLLTGLPERKLLPPLRDDFVRVEERWFGDGRLHVKIGEGEWELWRPQYWHGRRPFVVFNVADIPPWIK